jgi:hypothetical protein
MWQGWVLPRLRNRGLGRERITRTYRLSGIGESAVAAQLGEALLRTQNPIVATYARSDAVDVRVSGVADSGRSATAIVDEAEAAVLAVVGDYVWGYNDDTWPAVIGRGMAARGWNAALVEVGTDGSTATLLGQAPWLKGTRDIATGDAAALLPLAGLAREAGKSAGTWIGLAVRAVETGDDTRVELAAVGPWGVSESSLTAFLGGEEGRRRAGIAAAAFLHRLVRAGNGAQSPNAPAGTGGQ